MSNFVSYENANSLMTAIAQKFANLGVVFSYHGSVTFNNLPTPSDANVGFVYNVSNAFTTDDRFIEGTGKQYSAGTNVVIFKSSTPVPVEPVGTENPKELGWYEFTDGELIPTEDTAVDSSKTYAYYPCFFDILGNGVDTATLENHAFAYATEVARMIEDSTVTFAGASAGEIRRYYDTDNKVDMLIKFTSDFDGSDDVWDHAEEVDVVSLIGDAEPDSLTTAQVNALLALLQ